MDTALLLAGVLHARQHLNSARATALANAIYERVDWQWMLNRQPHASPTLAMAWRPGRAFPPSGGTPTRSAC